MAQNNVEYNVVEEAKAYVTLSGVQYPRPKVYAERFLEVMGIQANECRYELQGKVENANEDNTINSAYARLLIETQMNFDTEELKKTVGLVIALDTAKPTLRAYTGSRVFACSNLALVGAENVFSCDPMVNMENAFTTIRGYKDNAETEFRKQLEFYQNCKTTNWSSEEVNRKLGRLLELVCRENRYSKLGTTPITTAAKLMYTRGTPYEIKENLTTAWNVYNAVTQSLTNTNDFVTTPIKTQIISNLILN